MQFLIFVEKIRLEYRFTNVLKIRKVFELNFNCQYHRSTSSCIFIANHKYFFQALIEL